MKQNKYQSGSGHIVIIIALVVVLLGALGFIFWQNFMQSKPNEKSNNTTTITTLNLNDGYLVLEDWNVKIKYPTDLGSNVITYEKGSDGDYYDFSTERVSALGGNCANLVRLVRQTESTVPDTSGLIQVAQVGEYYYFINGPQTACSELDAGDTHINIVFPDIKMLNAFLATIEAL